MIMSLSSEEPATVNLLTDTQGNTTLLEFEDVYAISNVTVTVPSGSVTRATTGNGQVLAGVPTAKFDVGGSQIELTYTVNENMDYTYEREQSYNVVIEFQDIASTFTYIETIVQPDRDFVDDFTLYGFGGNTSIENGGTVTCEVASKGSLDNVLSRLYCNSTYTSGGKYPTEFGVMYSGDNDNSTGVTYYNYYIYSTLDFASTAGVGSNIQADYTLKFLDDSEFKYTVNYLVADLGQTLYLYNYDNSTETYEMTYSSDYYNVDVTGASKTYRLTVLPVSPTGNSISTVYGYIDQDIAGGATLAGNSIQLPLNATDADVVSTLSAQCIMVDGSLGTYPIKITQAAATMADKFANAFGTVSGGEIAVGDSDELSSVSAELTNDITFTSVDGCTIKGVSATAADNCSDVSASEFVTGATSTTISYTSASNATSSDRYVSYTVTITFEDNSVYTVTYKHTQSQSIASDSTKLKCISMNDAADSHTYYNVSSATTLANALSCNYYYPTGTNFSLSVSTLSVYVISEGSDDSFSDDYSLKSMFDSTETAATHALTETNGTNEMLDWDDDSPDVFSDASKVVFGVSLSGPDKWDGSDQTETAKIFVTFRDGSTGNYYITVTLKKKS